MDPLKDNISPDVKFSELRDALIGPNKIRQNVVIPNPMFGGQPLKSRNEMLVENFFESCAFKTAMSGVMGFALGAALGLFSASIGPDMTPVDQPVQTVKEVLKDMRSKSMAYAKNFAMLGIMFSATECAIESVSFSFIINLSQVLALFITVSR